MCVGVSVRLVCMHVDSPDNSVGTSDELRFRVPLMVCDEVPRLQPDPLLTLGQEAVETGRAFAHGHYWEKGKGERFLY